MCFILFLGRLPTGGCFMWMGEFHPHELIKVIVNQIEPLTEQQLTGVCGFATVNTEALLPPISTCSPTISAPPSPISASSTNGTGSSKCGLFSWHKPPPSPIAGKGGLPGGKVKLSGSVSSQYLTALLMAAPLAVGDI
ncbi:hypothetical protein POM88_033249 [Heracleum sosnowskyi]|uniref:Uncharacterized protein n=1 Tax=Heracleum sosnowskyi TaxID=360622 RepID=A0AAD8MKU7_9APIA|nr:hypothetical protein POM88_033249 [Heracleum sosnowskyi]